MIDVGVPLVAKIASHEKHTTTVKHYVAMDKDMTRKVGDRINASNAERAMALGGDDDSLGSGDFRHESRRLYTRRGHAQLTSWNPLGKSRQSRSRAVNQGLL